MGEDQMITGDAVKTQENLSVDVRWTWKPYRICYEIIKSLRSMHAGSVLEVVTVDNEGILNDLRTWGEACGHELVATERPTPGEARSLLRKGKPRRSDRTMTVVLSTANLDHVVYPLDKALAGIVLGMGVNVVFEGAGVRLLKRGYRPQLSGIAGRAFTSLVERVMRKQIGWPLPQESISILEDLGASFYLCGPSMVGYGVRETELLVRGYTIGAVVTWADLLARSDIQVFSNAKFEKP